MNTSVNRIYSSRKVNVYTALMFALAVMLLIVSCPLKRLLQDNFVFNSSSVVKTSQTNINQRTGADHIATANCCAVKKKTVLVKLDLSQQCKLPVPLYQSNITGHPGFDINYFLSGISYRYGVLVSSDFSTLSLFLQHRRLLI